MEQSGTIDYHDAKGLGSRLCIALDVLMLARRLRKGFKSSLLASSTLHDWEGGRRGEKHLQISYVNKLYARQALC